jgi:curli production assembly/transport component CsgG
VKTGQVLLSVVATKKILSYGLDGNTFRYVTFNRILQAEAGFTRNEPGSLAVEQAIEQAVLQFIIEGSARGLWAFRDKLFQSRIIEDYELSYLMAQAKAPPNQDGGQAKVAAAKSPAPTPTKTAGAAPQPAVAASAQQKPALQQSSLPAPAMGPQAQQAPKLAQGAGQQQQPAPQLLTAVAGNGQPVQLPPAPQIIVQPRTLEDEIPIAVR